MPRLFTCIWLPKDIKSNIIKFQNKIKKLPIKAKFVEPENIHITITFIGEIDENKINDLIKKIDSVINNFNKIKIELEGLKLIPSENFIRVIGIDVKDNESLMKLIKNIGSCIESRFYESTKLTLCRVKNIFNKNIVQNFIEKNRDIKIGSFEVEEISLVESILGRQGPTYKTIHKFKLL